MEVRVLRKAAGLTQAELASRAGVSRQLVGAVEAGRHLPRVDAAVAIAAALGVAVEALFGPAQPPVDALSGMPPQERALVRSGRVGDRVVTAPLRAGADGWDVADGMVEDGSVTALGRLGPGLVVAGCEPGLAALERLLREGGAGALAVSASSAAAAVALAAGRAHAAVVHGPDRAALPDPEVAVDRYHLASWRVGLAAPAEAAPGWWQRALAGEVPVVQRESGAAVQRAFAAAAGGPVAGPRVAGHLEAARRAVLAGMPAVTIEPAAVAVGAAFHPLESHDGQLWVGAEWRGSQVVAAALEVLAGHRFQRRLAAIGGYDLARCGDRAA